ncbi:TPA: restriction endonuclease [Pseudomonas aeruginosa]|uniref:restriction endonuclease n=1 Tax=Pseudomonas aeruginosa TaxID=287 RepID=UPI001CBD5099
MLNDLFRAYGIHVQENFVRRSPDSSAALEQIDGVIELNGTIHLVEMKWLKVPVGVGDFASHLARVMSRADASGIFISSSRYTEAVIEQCADFLNYRTNFLCTLKEIVSLLSPPADLADFLKAKSQAAIVGKQPFLEFLS